MSDSKDFNLNFNLKCASEKFHKKNLTILTPLNETGLKSYRIQGVIDIKDNSVGFGICVRNKECKDVFPYPFIIKCEPNINNSNGSALSMKLLKTDNPKIFMASTKEDIIKCINTHDQLNVTWKLSLECDENTTEEEIKDENTAEEEIKDCIIQTKKTGCQVTLPSEAAPDFKMKVSAPEYQLPIVRQNTNLLLIDVSGKKSIDSWGLRDRTLEKYDKGHRNFINIDFIPDINISLTRSEAEMNSFIQAITEALNRNPQGYHAILILVDNRKLTENDQNLIYVLKRIFGPSFLKTFGIVVVEKKDIFENECVDFPLTFTRWFNSQEEVSKAILNECDRRIVFVDCLSDMKQLGEEELKSIIKQVECLASEKKSYTMAMFKENEDSRAQLKIEIIKPMIHEEVSNSLRRYKLKYFQKQDLKEIEYLNELTDDLKKAESQRFFIINLDGGTGILHQELEDLSHFIDACRSAKIPIPKKVRNLHGFKQEKQMLYTRSRRKKGGY